MNKELDGTLGKISKFVEGIENAMQAYKDAIKDLPRETKNFTKEQKETYDKALGTLKTVAEEAEKKRKEHGDILASTSKKIREDELIGGKQHIANMETIGEGHLEGEKTRTETILSLQERLKKGLGEVDKVFAKDDSAENFKKKWKEKYDEIAKKTTDYTKIVGDSLSTVLTASSSFIDGEITRSKEKLEAVTKKLAGFQANLKKQTDDILSRGKAEAQAEINAEIDADGDGDKRDRKQDKYEELEELERLYNLETELDKKNEARKDDINYHGETLTQSEQARFDTLKTEHATYTQSLEAKTEAEKKGNDAKKALESEKAKHEKDIEKKESQKKKIEFAKQIIAATINIAQGVTKALAMGPIMGPIMASIVGAAGAVQIALMSSKKNKFQDGGLLHGSRHSAGGMHIQGSNIEVEGGEYVVNRDSTDKNLGLIRYINSQRRQLAPTDINSFFAKASQGFEPPFRQAFAQGGQLPQIEPSTNISNDLLVQAIQSIKFEPKVSVTDINTAQTNVVKVDAWTGM